MESVPCENNQRRFKIASLFKSNTFSDSSKYVADRVMLAFGEDDFAPVTSMHGYVPRIYFNKLA